MSTQHSMLRAPRWTPAFALASFVLTAWSVAPAAHAADWVAIAKSDRTEVFANSASLGVSPAPTVRSDGLPTAK